MESEKNKNQDQKSVLMRHGLWHSPGDYKELSTEQKRKLRRFLRNEHESDIEYLQDHPEVNGIVTLLFKKIEKTRPEHPLDFFNVYFAQSKAILQAELTNELNDSVLDDVSEISMCSSNKNFKN